MRCASTSLLLLAAAGAASARLQPLPHQAHVLQRRGPPSGDVLDINNYLSKYYNNGDEPIGHQDSDAGGQVVEITSAAGADDNSQSPQCSNTIFIGGAAVSGSFSTGWQKLPQITGFDLLRDVTVADGGIVQPYYQMTGRNPSDVKRLIISQPGLPRDTWKYVNLIRNAMLCAVANSTNNINLSEIMIAAPAWLNTDDAQAGAAETNDIVFSKGSWNIGSLSQGPGSTSVSSYAVMDTLLNALLQRFPNVNQVWIAGHSLGASFVQRYALVRKPDANDANLNFWSGNAGSYAWPTKNRPITPSGSCASTYDDWAYGISSGDGPAYRKSDIASNVTAVQQQYYNRRVVIALGLADDGAGDSACEAQFEGSTHLTRGQNLQKEEQSLPGGIPASHTFDYVQGVAHEDYLMFSSPAALQHLFVENFNVKKSASGSGSGGSSSGGSGGTKGGNSGSNGNSGSSGSTNSNGNSGGNKTGAGLRSADVSGPLALLGGAVVAALMAVLA
ncbi:hypothetical protein OC834_003696 [Tilletia horrida]|uniref:Fungal lipase-like domain-containing protein n=1 Tax=Tilletia horrida TaxID=155126 RepID=A0AAN6JJI5_9BASI|nr:hypothetical protein OC835_007217 [Tilletia horrida]KAK0528713.1 hypothetical protein OC842_004466 [Tilletia horrida]KAK0529435.1 hypothetical protein OC834_003696 [Tilletia horrida]KAK0557385.1 hypothetical protein OC844_005599 [Tilletia horrida]